MRFVTPVDGDEVGGQRLDLACVAKSAGIDATRTWDRGGQLTHNRDSLPVLAEDQHIICKLVDSRVIEKNGADVMESGDHGGLRK